MENNLFRTTTLAELQNNLPIYTNVLGAVKNDLSFTFLPWNMEMEEKFSSLLDQGLSYGKFVNYMLSNIIDTFCGVDFQSLKEPERLLILNQQYFANMMYIYIYLRVEELGQDLKISEFNCVNSKCGKPIVDWYADLGTLDVRVKEWDHVGNKAIHKLDNKFVLRSPILINNQTITGFHLMPSKWDYMESLNTDNSATVKKAMIKSSIAGFYNGDDLISAPLVAEQIVTKLSKYDIEKVMNEIAENNAGPIALIGGKCPKCSSEWNKMLDWKYGSFFGSSSL